MVERKSTMKGKQSVHYRTCSDDLLFKLSELPKSAGGVLCELLQHIDINDNCVQKDFNEIVKENAWDRGNSNRCLHRLKDEGIIKEVIDISGEARWMIDPRLVWSTSREKLRFSIVMFVLGAHEEAVKHHRTEAELVCRVDPITGLMEGEYQERVEMLDWLYE